MSAPVLHVIACAHGTHDAAGRVVIDGLRADLAALLDAEGPGAQVHEAYVDVQSPSLDEVVAALPPGEPAVIVPLLLSLGHHVHHDIHHAAAARPDTIAAAPLAGAGDDVEPRLVAVLAERVAQAVPAGEAATSEVILAAAGTRAADGQAQVHALAAALARATGLPVTAAFGAAATLCPTPSPGCAPPAVAPWRPPTCWPPGTSTTDSARAARTRSPTPCCRIRWWRGSPWIGCGPPSPRPRGEPPEAAEPLVTRPGRAGHRPRPGPGNVTNCVDDLGVGLPGS